MKTRCYSLLSAVLFALVTLSAAQTVRGEDLIVDHTTSSGHFATIQAAIDNANSRLAGSPSSSFRIIVKASSTAYTGPITLRNSNVPIIGERTDGTFISGGSDALVTASGIANVQIRNLTFRSAGTAIAVSNNSGISITNNIFQAGGSSTAISVVDSPSTSVKNNTFYKNKIAISTNSDITIINNIFSTNGTAISAPGTTLTKVSYNDYFPSLNSGLASIDSHSLPNATQTASDPKFVDADNSDFTRQDFHLQDDSPCIGAGDPQEANSFDTNTSDMGAFGGPNSDSVLRSVSGLTATVSPSTPSTIVLTWNATGNRNVTAYRVYYGTASRSYGGTQATKPSPVTVSTTTASLEGLPLTGPAAPEAPVLTGLTPASSSSLQATWTSVTGATGYRVYYSTATFDQTSLPATFVTVTGGSATSATIPNLTTGTHYFVAVSAIAQTTFFIAVTAVIDGTLPASFGASSSNESSYSTEVSQGVGPVVESATISNLRDEFPEATTAFPNLKSEGCFIATAAFGFYSAPQVQALRDFRDRFLLTNAPGRAFVAWYYHYGPQAAHFINVHPWLKAPVRVALLPLIVMALVFKGSSPAATSGLVLLAALWLALVWRRRVGHTEAAALGSVLLTLCVIVLPTIAQGAEVRPDRPHWSLELKAGAFFPQTSGWSKYYDSNYTGEYGAALAYKVHRLVEIGLEGSYLTASGKGQLLQHQATSGSVTYELAPLSIFVLGRALFDEDQLLVPYAGAGYTRLFYRQEVKGEGTTEGSVNGFNARAGLQILLDGLERDASRSLYKDYGIHHTYLFVEGKYLDARADTVSGGSVNLGGTSALAGFLFEF